jgi:hypothetical protein
MNQLAFPALVGIFAVEIQASSSAGRFIWCCPRTIGGTLADHEGSLLSAMVPISFRGANDDFQGG